MQTKFLAFRKIYIEENKIDTIYFMEINSIYFEIK